MAWMTRPFMKRWARIPTIRGEFAIESTTKDRENKTHGRFQRNQTTKKLTRHKCHFCDYATSHKTHRTHIRIHTDNHIDVILVPRCSHENRPCCNTHDWNLISVDRSVSHWKVKKSVIEGKCQRPRLECNSCKYTTHQKYYLIKHMQIHSGEKPFECSIYFQTFSQWNNLKHYLWTHIVEVPFFCSKCSQRFLNAKPSKISFKSVESLKIASLEIGQKRLKSTKINHNWNHCYGNFDFLQICLINILTMFNTDT